MFYECAWRVFGGLTLASLIMLGVCGSASARDDDPSDDCLSNCACGTDGNGGANGSGNTAPCGSCVGMGTYTCSVCTCNDITTRCYCTT